MNGGCSTEQSLKTSGRPKNNARIDPIRALSSMGVFQEGTLKLKMLRGAS